MTKRAPEEVYASLIAAGFPREAAITMTAIAGAESGWRNDALGDLNLQDATWGPSYGLFQIRTYKGKTGSGDWRDIAWLTGSDLHQAQAAWHISAQGTNFTPWTVFTNGAYQQHMAAARAAADKVTGTAAPATGDGDTWWLNEWTTSWLPWVATGNPYEVAGAAAGTAAGELSELPGEWLGGLLTGARHVLLEAAAGVAVAALVIGGLVLWSRGRQ